NESPRDLPAWLKRGRRGSTALHGTPSRRSQNVSHERHERSTSGSFGGLSRSSIVGADTSPSNEPTDTPRTSLIAGPRKARLWTRFTNAGGKTTVSECRKQDVRHWKDGLADASQVLFLV